MLKIFTLLGSFAIKYTQIYLEYRKCRFETVSEKSAYQVNCSWDIGQGQADEGRKVHLRLD